jgi:hypothetical protein
LSNNLYSVLTTQMSEFNLLRWHRTTLLYTYVIGRSQKKGTSCFYISNVFLNKEKWRENNTNIFCRNAKFLRAHESKHLAGEILAPGFFLFKCPVVVDEDGNTCDKVKDTLKKTNIPLSYPSRTRSHYPYAPGVNVMILFLAIYTNFRQKKWLCSVCGLHSGIVSAYRRGDWSYGS